MKKLGIIGTTTLTGALLFTGVSSNNTNADENLITSSEQAENSVQRYINDNGINAKSSAQYVESDDNPINDSYRIAYGLEGHNGPAFVYVKKDTGELVDGNGKVLYGPEATDKDSQLDQQFSEEQNQTKQGDRPFGGVPPKGMTNEEYSQLEQNVPNPNDVSPEKYNQAVERESVRIANEKNKTIYLPQGTIKPGVSTDQTQNNQQTSDKKTSKELLPETGTENNNNVTVGIGLVSLILGLSVILIRRIRN